MAAGETIPLDRMRNDLGMEATTKLLNIAAASPLIEFDGKLRFAQIQKNGLEYPNGMLDLLILYTIGDHLEIAFKQPPVGTRIESIAFDNDQLKVVLHGSLVIKDRMIHIPSDRAETYDIPWTANQTPAVMDLTSMIRHRHK